MNLAVQHRLSEPCRPIGSNSTKQATWLCGGLLMESTSEGLGEKQKGLLREGRGWRPAEPNNDQLAWDKLKFGRSISQKWLGWFHSKENQHEERAALDDRKVHEAGESGQSPRKVSTL